MTLRLYTLDEDGVPVEEPDFQKWRRCSGEDGTVKVAEDTVGEMVVVTSFLGHTYGRENPPVLWETYIFGGQKNNTKETCSGTRADALKMHAQVLERLKQIS